MRTTLPLRPLRFMLAVLLLALAACGSAATTEPGAPATQASDSTTAAAAPELNVDYATLPQSKTPEGYYMLGEPDAPILMQHYSDFL